MVPHRRSFLAASLVGLACTATRRVPAADGLAVFSFVVVSDTHLGRQDSKTPEKQWRQAVAEIAAGPGDFVLHLGDVVDGGREAQYPVYADTRMALKKPVYEVPGNHDPVELFEKHVRTPIDHAFDHGGVRFLLFNNSRTGSHLGFVTPRQAEWLEKRCREAADKDLRLVAGCHVPVHANAAPDRGWYVKPADGRRRSTPSWISSGTASWRACTGTSTTGCGGGGTGRRWSRRRARRPATTRTAGCRRRWRTGRRPGSRSTSCGRGTCWPPSGRGG